MVLAFDKLNDKQIKQIISNEKQILSLWKINE